MGLVVVFGALNYYTRAASGLYTDCEAVSGEYWSSGLILALKIL